MVYYLMNIELNPFKITDICGNNVILSNNEIKANKILKIISELLPNLRFYGWEYKYNYFKQNCINDVFNPNSSYKIENSTTKRTYIKYCNNLIFCLQRKLYLFLFYTSHKTH